MDHYPLLKIKTVNHDKDYMLFLISISSILSVGKAVGLIKQNTARELKQKISFLK